MKKVVIHGDFLKLISCVIYDFLKEGISAN
jgi:hypothetical protein